MGLYLSLLRLCDDDLPGLQRGGALALLALLLLHLHRPRLLGQREVVLDGLRRGHRLTHLLLWAEPRRTTRTHTQVSGQTHTQTWREAYPSGTSP